MTVPPLGGRQDGAALAAGDVDADHGDVGRAAGGAATASRRATGSRASATTTSSASPLSRSSVGLGLVRDDADRARAPASRAAARLQRAATCRPADDGDDRRRCAVDAAAHDPRGERRGAADVHDRQAQSRAAGRRGARPRWSGRRGSRSRRRAPARERPSQRARPSSITSGVRVSETRVATRSPTARPSVDSGPTSSTVPISMPPEPVTGFCILPRSATIVEHLRAYGVAVAAVLGRQLAERRGVEVQRLDPDPRPRRATARRRASSRWAACGSTPAGSSTRCRPIGDARGPGTGSPASADSRHRDGPHGAQNLRTRRKILRRRMLDLPQDPSVS